MRPSRPLLVIALLVPVLASCVGLPGLPDPGGGTRGEEPVAGAEAGQDGGADDDSAAPPPDVPADVLLRPVYANTEGVDAGGGSAFALEWSDGRLLLITAHHVLDFSFDREMTTADLERVLTGASAVSEDSGAEVSGRTLVPIPGATADAPSTDINAFLLDDAVADEVGVLRLADRAPGVGDRVYLVGSALGEDGQRLYPATVTEAGNSLSYEFDEDFEQRTTSGSAIVDADGRVVGVHVRGGVDEGANTGSATPWSDLRELLTDGLDAL